MALTGVERPDIRPSLMVRNLEETNSPPDGISQTIGYGFCKAEPRVPDALEVGQPRQTRRRSLRDRAGFTHGPDLERRISKATRLRCAATFIFVDHTLQLDLLTRRNHRTGCRDGGSNNHQTGNQGPHELGRNSLPAAGCSIGAATSAPERERDRAEHPGSQENAHCYDDCGHG